MARTLEDSVTNVKTAAARTIKNRMYDVITITIIIVFIALSIGVLERRIISADELLDFAVECVPLLFTSILLDTNMYSKGVFHGKQQAVYKNSIDSFSSLANSLHGGQIGVLSEFCNYFNSRALKDLQTAKLKTVGITYEQFVKNKVVDGAVVQKSLISLSKHELKELLHREQYCTVMAVKRMKIRGIKVNSLLGTNDVNDPTDTGLTETQLKTKKTLSVLGLGLISTLVLSIIGIKDIMQWGWFGIALVLFKAAYVFCKSYMSYFSGYSDATIHLVNHNNRRSDILKEGIYWINKNYPELINDGESLDA